MHLLPTPALRWAQKEIFYVKPEQKISIILVSYNSADMISACLDSIQATGFSIDEIFVIDNASTDGSAGMIAHVDVVENEIPWLLKTL